MTHCLYLWIVCLTHRVFSVVWLILSNNDNFSHLLCFSFYPPFLNSYSCWFLTTTYNMLYRGKIEKANFFWAFWLYRIVSLNDSNMCLCFKTLYRLWDQWVIFDSQLLKEAISKTFFTRKFLYIKSAPGKGESQIERWSHSCFPSSPYVSLHQPLVCSKAFYTFEFHRDYEFQMWYCLAAEMPATFASK